MRWRAVKSTQIHGTGSISDFRDLQFRYVKQFYNQKNSTTIFFVRDLKKVDLIKDLLIKCPFRNLALQILVHTLLST